MPEQARYVRPTLGGWLRPLIFGTFLTTYLSAVLYAFGFDVGFIGRWVALAVGLAVGTGWACTYGLLLGLVDLTLLGLRLRQLPVGWGAWANAAGSALSVHAVYALIKPHSFYKMGVWGILAAVLLPMLASALIARLAWGKRP